MSENTGGYVACLVVAVASLAASFFAGANWAKSQTKITDLSQSMAAVQNARTVEQTQMAVTEAAGSKIAAAAVQIHQQTQEAIRYVPYLIPADAVQRFPLSDGFVRVVDASITGDMSSLAENSGKPDDAASPVAANAAAITLAYNFGICRESIDREQQWRSVAIELGLAPKPEVAEVAP